MVAPLALPPHVQALVAAGNLRLTGGGPKSAARVQGGRKAHREGDDAEGVVLAITAAAYADRVRLRKRPTPAKRLPPPAWAQGHLKPGQFVACFEKKSGPDIDVHWRGRPGGLLEIKSTGEASIRLDAVAYDQAVELQAFHDLGLLALVLVRVRSQWWVVRWPDWRSPSGRASLAPEELDQVGARCELVHARGPGGVVVVGPAWVPAAEGLLA